jgi:hypothetical protein
MHVWTQSEFLSLILHCRERFGDAFDIEAAARRGIEFVVVLRKSGALPAPPGGGSASRRLTRPLRAAKGALRGRGRRDGQT